MTEVTEEVKEAEKPPKIAGKSRFRRLLPHVALLVWIALLFTWKMAPETNPMRPAPGAVAVSLGAWLTQWLLGILADFAGFAVLGFSVPRAFRARFSSSMWLAAFSLFFTAVTTYGLVCVDAVGVPRIELLVVPAAGAFFGLIVGLLWKPGRRRRLLAATAVLTAASTTALCVLAWFAVERRPLDIDPPELTEAEKHRLITALDGVTADGNARRVQLTERDLNLLTEWGLSYTFPRGKSDVTFGSKQVSALVTIPVPTLESFHVNANIIARTELVEGQPRVSIERLQVGRLHPPAALVDPLWQVFFWRLRQHPQVQELLASVRDLQIESGSAQLVYSGENLKERLLPSLIASLSGTPDVSKETRLYLEQLLAVANEIPKGPLRFQGFVEEAFKFARERSVENDPIRENRAAIFSLAIILGHRQIEKVVGPVLTDEQRDQLGDYSGRVTLRGRSDWCQHFVVSGALVLIANESLANVVGTMKELRDSDGGSGFSFPEIMADRAGAKFARVAIRDEESARKLQKDLSEGFNLDELFPSPEGLPEGLSDADFQEQFGGVGGKKYREIEAEITRRLDECDLLK